MPLLVSASALRLGTATASAAYLGSARVWPAPPNASLLAATTPQAVAALVGGSSISGALAGTTPRLVGDLAGTTPLLAVVSGATPMPTGALAGTVPIPGVLAGAAPMPAGTLTGVTPLLGALAGTTPALSGALTGTADAATRSPVLVVSPRRAASRLPQGALIAAGPVVISSGEGVLGSVTPRPSGALTGTAAGGGGTAETFSGSDGSAWPSPWTGATGATVDQQSGAGRLVTAASTYSQTFIHRTAPDDTELLFRWRWQGVSATVDIVIRGAGVNYGDNPKWVVRHLPDAIWITGTAGLLANVSTTHTVSTWYWSRIRAQGSTVQARTWVDGGTEPGTWTATGTDATSPASGGYLIFRTETADASAATALFDDLTIADLSSGGPLTGALAAASPRPSGALTGTAAGGGSGGFGTAAFGTAPFGA